MTDISVRPLTALTSGAGLRLARVAALLRHALFGAVPADDPRLALDELPDNVLKDLGLARSEIPFLAGTPASAEQVPTHDARDCLNRSVATRDTATRLSHVALRLLLVAAVAVSALVVPSRAARAEDAPIERGRYLVTLGGCTDCHTPGYFFGKPDMARFLGGSEVGFEIPRLGVFRGPNLTPDRETGLGQRLKAHIYKMSNAPNQEIVNDAAKLIMHRLIARRFAHDASLVERARASHASVSERHPDCPFVRDWNDLLALPTHQLRRLLTSRHAEMTRLRLSSPFVIADGIDFTDPPLRRRIRRAAKRIVERGTAVRRTRISTIA